jgi:CRP-like cAMP-binding protein
MEANNPIFTLKKFIDTFYKLELEDWDEFAKLWEPYSARRKALLTKVDETEKYLYFVLDGIQRIYSIDKDGREATIIFTYAPSFGGVIDSLITQTKSNFYYEALNSSSFLRISIADLQLIMLTRPKIALMVNYGISAALGGLLTRLAELQSLSSEEKFKTLLNRSPHILKLVPHKYLANYLGIDPTNFSKLINSVLI